MSPDMVVDHPITVEEAQAAELSMNPFKRAHQVGELAATLGYTTVGLGLREQPCYTRRGLVEFVERMTALDAEARLVVANLQQPQ